MYEIYEIYERESFGTNRVKYYKMKSYGRVARR